MDTLEILQDILEYIDDHIAEDISPDSLAVRAGFSTWHFCRVFRWGVGYSVMGYVRNRRLAFAAYALSSGKRILDISLEYGFQTHSGFSKAFRRYFGCSPETYRMHVQCEKPSAPRLLNIQKYSTGGIVLEPKFMTLPAVKLGGYVLKTTSANGENFKTVTAFWNAYMTDGRTEKLHRESFVKKHGEYGACFPEDPETGEFEYVIGVEMQEDADIPDGYHVREIPAATYAVFSTPPSDAAGFSASIQGVWQYIFNEWFPNSGYKYAPGCVDFEYYDERCMSETEKVCDICIPVI